MGVRRSRPAPREKEPAMEPLTFDALARSAAKGASRRQLLRFALGAIGGMALVRQEAAAQSPCNAPFILCDGMCVYSLTSNEHCGACDNACGDLVCIEGVCTSCENVGLTTCDDLIGGGLYCADLTDSVNDCGTCGNGCTTGPCVNGVCTSTVDCELGFTECWGKCVDLQTDTFNCGSCSMACAGEVGPGESSVGVCVAGECQLTCLPGYTICGGRCLDLSSDPANCGACGNDCGNEACVNGTCGGTALPSDDSGATGGATVLPATGSGAASRSVRETTLGRTALAGAAAALAALGWRLFPDRKFPDEPDPPAS